MSPPQSRRESSRTAPPDQSSPADRPARKSPQAACPHQKNRIDPSYQHPRILLCELDSHKFRKGRYFSSCPKEISAIYRDMISLGGSRWTNRVKAWLKQPNSRMVSSSDRKSTRLNSSHRNIS